MEWEDGGQPIDLELGEGASGALQRFLASGAGDDELAQERVPGGTDHRAGLNARVQPDARTGGRLPRCDGAGSGQEAAPWILGVDPELDRVTARARVAGAAVWPRAERLAVGDTEHLADQVDAGNLLGHGVLDLQARVDFEEGDGAILPDEELTGSGTNVACLTEDGLGRRPEQVFLRAGQVRGGSLLDELLVAALQGAVAGRDDNHSAVRVGQALGFHVPRLVQVALDEALAAAECTDSLADRRLIQFRDLRKRAGDLQATPAAAERRLDGDGQAVLLGECDDIRCAGHGIGGARDQRRAGPLGDLPGGDLVTEIADGLRRRPDPGQASVENGLGEVGVLRQEPVTRVDCVRTGLRGGCQDLAYIQVASGRGIAAERERLVGGPDIRRVPVRVGVDRDAADSGVAAGPGDADRDLAAVGDEDLGQGHARSTSVPACWLVSTIDLMSGTAAASTDLAASSTAAATVSSAGVGQPWTTVISGACTSSTALTMECCRASWAAAFPV